MIISFSNTPLVMACVVGILILASHILPHLIKGRAGQLIGLVGIPLHLALFVLLFFAGAELDLVVLCLVASLFVYSLVNYSFYLKNKREADK